MEAVHLIIQMATNVIVNKDGSEKIVTLTAHLIQIEKSLTKLVTLS